MLYEIKDIYNYNKEENTKMLSGFTSSVDSTHDFWKPYRDNSAYFDRMFKKMFSSWFPFDQEGELADVSEDFAEDVKAWLMINDKRYSELYRIQTIADDEKYSLTDNVYEVETIEESGEHSSEFNKGAQTDTEDLERVKGSQTDTQDNERVKGQEQIDTDATNTTGSTGKTITNSVSAFNDSTFSNADKSEEEDDSRTDTVDQTVTDGQRTDTEDLSTTYGQRTDTEDNSRVSGARTDTDSGSDSKTIERNRSGNIGVKTVSQMLDDQFKTWDAFNFYNLIFNEIARELLRGC